MWCGVVWCGSLSCVVADHVYPCLCPYVSCRQDLSYALRCVWLTICVLVSALLVYTQARNYVTMSIRIILLSMFPCNFVTMFFSCVWLRI